MEQHEQVAALRVADEVVHFVVAHAVAAAHDAMGHAAEGDVDLAIVNQNSHFVDLGFDPGQNFVDLGLGGQLCMDVGGYNQLEALDPEEGLGKVLDEGLDEGGLVEDHCSRCYASKEVHCENHLDRLGYHLYHLEEDHRLAAVVGVAEAVRTRIEVFVDCSLMVEDQEVVEEAGSYK